MSARPDWLRTLGRAAYHAAPTSFWRSVDGLQRDVASLPVGLRDPARRSDPWEMIRLTLEAVLAGQWRPEPQYAGGQDLLVLRR